MPYQYKREPLTADEANRLANTCKTHEEKLVIWTLLDTGLRVSEFANLKRDNLDWQQHRLRIYGKGGPYGKNVRRKVSDLPKLRKEGTTLPCYPRIHASSPLMARGHKGQAVRDIRQV